MKPARVELEEEEGEDEDEEGEEEDDDEREGSLPPVVPKVKGGERCVAGAFQTDASSHVFPVAKLLSRTALSPSLFVGCVG